MRFQKLLQIARADLHPDTERGKLVRSAMGTASLKVGAILLAFLASLIYARALGPRGYGLYAYVIAWVSVLMIPAGLGMPSYLVREGAKAPASLGWLRRWADRRVLVSGIVAGLLLAAAFFIPQAADARWLFLIAAPLPLFSVFSSVRQGLLQANGWIVRSQIPQLLITPVFILAGLVAVWFWRGHLNPVDLIVISLLAEVLEWIINAMQFRRSGGPLAQASDPSVRVVDALPFMWLDGLYLVTSRIDLILLGAFRGAHDVGIYAIGMRAAEFVPFFLTVTNITIGPKISRLYRDNQQQLLQRLATATARRVLLVTALIGLVFFIGAGPLLGTIYGSAYVGGAIVLQILAIGQVATVLSGPVGALLNMTAHAQLSAKSFGFSAVLNLLLCLTLIPRYGMTGAAASTAISMAFCCLLRWIMVRRHLGIRPSAFGL